MKKSQNGFVLVSVLLITSISTFYAFSEIRGNRLQERMGGNQQEEMNARFLAEKGILVARDHVITQIALQKTDLQISASVGSYVQNFGTGASVHIADISPTGDLTLISSASYNTAQAHMKAVIKRIDPLPDEVFDGGIIACEGVKITGSGKVDSYDSSQGVYDPALSTGLGDIKTVSDNADIVLSGGAKVDGNVSATGEFKANSGYVNGDINANKDVYLSTVAQVDNVGSGGDFRFDSDSSLSGSANIVGDVNLQYGGEAQQIDAKLNYGGSSNVDHSIIAGEGVSNNVVFDTVSTSECDPHDIGSEIIAMRADMVTRGITNTDGTGVTADDVITTMTTQHTAGGDPLSFTTTGAQVFDSDSGQTKKIILPNDISSFIGGDELNPIKDRPVYIFDDLNLVNQGIEIEGDITIYVKGDLTTSGGGSGFTLASGATGTLTIIAEGTVNIGSDSQVFPDAELSGGIPPISVFSSFDSETSDIIAAKSDYREKQAIAEGLEVSLKVKDKANQDAQATKAQAISDGLSSSELVPLIADANAKQADFTSARNTWQSAYNLEIAAKASFETAKSGATDAFVYNGATEMYGAVYAPKGYIDITASGNLMGSLRGKEIVVSGDGGIHYDTALSGLLPGYIPPDPDYGLFLSMFYYYP